MNLCIGFLELNSIAKGVEAADRILKTAETELIFAKAGCPGKYYILFSGEVAAVTSSLEAGKDADIVVTDGCPFEVSTKVKHVFIDGKTVELSVE